MSNVKDHLYINQQLTSVLFLSLSYALRPTAKDKDNSPPEGGEMSPLRVRRTLRKPDGFCLGAFGTAPPTGLLGLLRDEYKTIIK